VKTILFDLDGTLLPINTDQFIGRYMKAVAAHVGHLIPPDRLAAQLMEATIQVIQSTDLSKTNAQVFGEHFYPSVGLSEAELTLVFEQFYDEEFPKLRATIEGLPGVAREAVQAVIDQGYEVVVATNPLFPMAAIQERLRWIGADHFPWRLITSYEEMHAAKPNPDYYKEILRLIGRRPEECLMVGNDVDEDGAANKAGIQTFFITDQLINKREKPLPEGRHGSMADFVALVKAGRLPEVVDSAV
jgi:FMN phosphatase YigB (HAD superfamily)